MSEPEQKDKQHEDNEKDNDKPLGFFEIIIQGVALIFAVQNHSGRKRLMDLAETNPLPVVIAGLVSTVIFFSFCFLTSQLLIHLLTD